jgi:hypothetical protein
MKLLKSLVLVVAAGLMIAACGGASTPSDVVKKVLDAQASFDYGTVKKYVVKDLVPQIEEVEKQFESPEAKAAIEASKVLEGDQQVKYDVVKEEIDGDSAKVTVKMSVAGREQEFTLPLVKEDGAWKVSTLDFGGK